MLQPLRLRPPYGVSRDRPCAYTTVDAAHAGVRAVRRAGRVAAHLWLCARQCARWRRLVRTRLLVSRRPRVRAAAY